LIFHKEKIENQYENSYYYLFFPYLDFQTSEFFYLVVKPIMLSEQRRNIE